MQKYEYLTIDAATGTYQFVGCFDKFSIPRQWKVIEASFKETTPVIVDLKNVSECDSALIALLVEVKRQYTKVSIIHAPDNLVQLLE